MWYQGSKMKSSLNELKSISNMVERTQPIVHEFVERTVGLHAYIVIDSLRNGQSCGGLRIADDLTLEEIKTLASSMTRHPFHIINDVAFPSEGKKMPSGILPITFRAIHP
jgi:hypothetical protein